MSETASARVAMQARGALARSRRNRLNPLEALEQGFTLFQSTFSQEAWRYYTGAVPLVASFIPMWVINGQIRLSNGVLLIETAVLAGAYFLRAVMVAGYVQRVRQSAFGTTESKPANAFARAAAMGRLLAWKITLGIATLATLATVAGAPWFYAACEFADLEAGEDTSERHSLRRCLALAGQWYGGSLLLLLMVVPLWGAVWLNGFVLAIVLPQLLHSIFGVNTLLSTQMGIFSLLRSAAFWFALLGGAWLALDPIVKCTFVVVYQHLRSRREGEDLRGLLARLPREQQKKAEMMASGAGGRRSAMIGAVVILLTALLLGTHVPSARALQTPTTSGVTALAGDSAGAARVERLREALTEESQRAIYRWHDAEHPSPPTWLDTLLSKIGNAIRRAVRAIWNFVRRLWPRGLTLSSGANNSGWHMKDLRLWLALIAVLTLASGGLLFWLRRRRDAAELALPVAIAPLPDLSNAAVASQQSEEEWFALAERLEREGELRLALRATYLGLLAGLAQREWLTIRRDRTNREYLEEFTRRWRRRPQAAAGARAEIPEKLRGSLRVFERVWYGSFEVTPAVVAAYRQGQRELLNHV